MGRSAPVETFTASLTDFFTNSNVGLAVFDEKLRYQAVNPYLAKIHCLPVESHLGQSIHAILGSVAAGPEPAIRRVLATGEPVCNYEVRGRLPTKTVAECWIDNFFPIKNERGEVRQVGAVVVPIGVPSATERIDQRLSTSGPVLRSWKEISAYVGTCPKTVQRWEQKYKFPIRRVKAKKGAVVFAMRDEVDLWLSHGARTSLRDKWSWATFINSSLPTLILDDDRVILDANICMANLIGAPPDDLVGQSLDAIMADTSHTRIDQEWLLLRKTGALVGLRNFFRPDGGVFAAEYALRSVQPGIRSLTFTSLRQDPIAEEKIFHRAGPRHLVL